MKKLASLLTVCVLFGALASCGGGGGGGTTGNQGGTPTGVDTPSKVSVANTK
jgi:hypothetical protein